MSRLQRRSLLLGAPAAGLGLGLSLGLAPRIAFAGGKWKTLAKEAGITVTLRREKDRQFPTFRGTGRVRANMLDIIAVIQDADRHAEWLHQCSAGKRLKEIDENTQVIYNRIDSPWPVKDRDVVIRGKLAVVTPGKEVKIRFRAVKTKLKGAVKDVVRMPLLEGHWYMVAMGEDKTLVEYQVNADPGGELPEWLVEQASKELPLFTIKNLRKQVAKTVKAGSYEAFKKETRAKHPEHFKNPDEAPA